MAQQTLRNMPPIVFVRDEENAAVAEIDRLLAIADFGPPDEKDFIENDFREPPALDTEPPSLSGIDHEVLNRQILEYRRKKEKGLAAESSWLGLRQPRRKARPPRGDSSLRDFLRGLEGDAGRRTTAPLPPEPEQGGLGWGRHAAAPWLCSERWQEALVRVSPRNSTGKGQ
nr:putative ribosome-binding factor A, mitochondrial [Dasypus novemcinctus]